MDFVQVNNPLITDEDKLAVMETLDANWISSSGPAVALFEQAWADYCGRKFGIAVANGTAALELGVRALGIGPGDEVIIPSFTIISCASAVLLAGGIPVLVDVSFENFCIDVTLIENAITSRTKAIMAVHIYGYAADMTRIQQLGKKYNLKIIEDAAEMHGGEIEISSDCWQKAGSFGEISTFSFFVNKLISTGEGGMILTDDIEIANNLRLLRNLGFTEPRYLHKIQGFNYRITAMQAALGLSQVPRMNEILEIKSRMYLNYTFGLSKLGKFVRTPIYPKSIRSSYWVYPLITSSERVRDGLARYLLENGVETRNFFRPMSSQPFLSGKVVSHGEFTNSEKLSSCGLYLPSGLGLTENEQNRVIELVKNYYSNSSETIE